MKYLNHEKEICMIDLITASIQSYTKTMKKLLVRIEVEMVFAAHFHLRPSTFGAVHLPPDTSLAWTTKLFSTACDRKPLFEQNRICFQNNCVSDNLWLFSWRISVKFSILAPSQDGFFKQLWIVKQRRFRKPPFDIWLLKVIQFIQFCRNICPQTKNGKLDIELLHFERNGKIELNSIIKLEWIQLN